MGYFYELINWQKGFPVRGFIHSVEGFKTHWHNAIELLLVLKGEVKIGVAEEKYTLKENDIILINNNEVHNITRTKGENILLAIQIDPSMIIQYFSDFQKIKFNCKSFMYSENEQERFNIIRHYMAKIIWEYNKKSLGYELEIASQAYSLVAYLVNNCTSSILEDSDKQIDNKDLARLQRILTYINQNAEKKITLKEIAKKEQVSYYHLSRFIKENLGMTFQEYLNAERLNKAISMLLSDNKTITEISYDSGFSSIKIFNKLFKETFNCSPLEYKNTYKKLENKHHSKYYSLNKEVDRSRTYLDVDRNAGLKKLFSYLKSTDMKKQTKYSKENIVVDVNTKGEYFEHYWKRLTTFSRASEGLRKGWQNQLKEMQQEVGFEYIRFHSIFSDDMMVYNIDEKGNIIYNWSYIDELFDFLKSVNIKPFVELGFMPSEIKKGNEVVFWWKANISQPKNIKLWTDLVKEFIKHCINRYGLKEVENWYFEVWNEPELENVFWVGGKEQYFEFYKETVLAVKSISKNLKVGGPSISYNEHSNKGWLESFFNYCNKNNVPLDFVTLHIYPEIYNDSNEDAQKLMLKFKQTENFEELITYWVNMKRIYSDENHTYMNISSAKNIMGKNSFSNVELHITEWNASSSCRNFIHDTCFTSTFIVKNVLDCIGEVSSLGYWTFTDIMEEAKAGISSFHGGFGLINKDGLKKPSYYAYYLLSKLGNFIIDKGNEYIITKEDENVQILIYNYSYFDELFSTGDTSLLTKEERYLVFEEKPTKQIKLNIKGLKGKYKVTKYKLNREKGSVFDEWKRMGMPENMTEEELQYLKGKSIPNINIKYLDLNGEYSGELNIPVHGIEVITLDRQIL